MDALSLVIFDCDGVLFDSCRANIGFYNAVLERLGRPPLDPEWEERAHVMASAQLFGEMFRADSALADAARAAARAVDYTSFYELMQPAPGLYEVLAALKRSYRLAMASNRGSTVQGVVRRFGLDRFLDLAVGVHDVARPKPYPDLLEKCLADCGVTAESALYVGDAESDRLAAQAAGVAFISVGVSLSGSPWVAALSDLPGLLSDGETTLCGDLAKDSFSRPGGGKRV